MHQTATAAALALLLALGGLTALPPARAAADEPVKLVVRHRHGRSAHARAAARDQAGVAHAYALSLPDTEVVTVAAGQADAALASLNADPDVGYAQTDGVVRQAALPPLRVPAGDPGVLEQYALRNTGQLIAGAYRGTPGADMSVRYAWNLSRGTGVVVAVVDTGVDRSQPDLAGQFATNPREIPGNGVDDDGNGRVDDVSGWDFVDRDSDPAAADTGHGTHVAGIIAAAADGAGTLGVAPAAKVIPLRVLGATGYGNWDAVAQAFDYAGAMGVPIVNASLGGDGNDRVVEDAMAAHPDTLYVVAAGNGGRSLDGRPVEPCSAPAANVLCVGASDQNDARAGFSNWSATNVDVFAPGFAVYSTVPGGAHAWWDGTSMASPNAAGVAALAVAAGAPQRGAALKQLVMDHVDAKAALSGLAVTGGRVNALAVVRAVRPDTDDDGVADTADRCPSEYGAGDDGCPVPAPAPVFTPQPLLDADGDGVVDTSDRCPARRGSVALRGCAPRVPKARASVRRGVLTLAVRADAKATLSAVVVRVGCSARGCTKRLRSVTDAAGQASVRAGRLAPARYRVTLRASVQGVASGPAGVTVRVR